MKTLGIVALVVLGGGIVWYLWKQGQPGGAFGGSVINRVAPKTIGEKVQSAADQIGAAGGSLVSRLFPGGSAVSGVFAQQGKDIVGGTVEGFRTAGTGLTQIASGNVFTGAGNVGLGAAETAYSATGAKAVVNLVKGLNLNPF